MIWRNTSLHVFITSAHNQGVSNCAPSSYPLLHYNIHKATLTEPILKHTAPQHFLQDPVLYNVKLR